MRDGLAFKVVTAKVESLRPFLVCIHDATPAYARETEVMLRDLSPLIGRRLSLGVVPNWQNSWPLSAHAEYCAMVRERSEELLLHGYFHQRQLGSGLVSWLAEGTDEMNGLAGEATRQLIEMGQHDFSKAFGQTARGFLAPAWQQGHVRAIATDESLALAYVLGFFSIEPRAGQRIPLATFTWDCGRYGALGHVGHSIGWLRHAMHRGVPTLAIHPRDLQRGYWPKIIGLIQTLLATGHEPTTPSELLNRATQKANYRAFNRDTTKRNTRDAEVTV